ncbi:MAG: tandem-95 repeat protein, partial [Gammaproteobacteria bacterium]
NFDGTWTYTPAASDDSAVAFTYTITDGTDSVAGTASLDITPANDPPVANDDAAAIGEDSGANTIDVLLNDSTAPDVGESLTVVAFTPATNGSVAIIGGGTAVTYTPNASFTGNDSFTYTISDGNGGTAIATVGVTVNNVDNDTPAIFAPGTQITPEDTPRVFSTGNGNAISVNDPDAGVSPLQVTLAAANGTLTLSGIAGLTFTTGDGTTDATMTFAGTQAAINAALDGMSFMPTLNFTGTTSVSIATNDLGATGVGGPQSDSEIVDITVVLVNDSPVVTVTGTATFTEDGPPTFVASTTTVTDVDSPNLAWAEVAIAAPDGTWETLSADTTGTSITATYNPLTGVLTLNGADTRLNYEQVLRSLQYHNASDAPNTSAAINITVSDGGSVSNVASRTIAITRVNDAPTANIGPASFSAVEDSVLPLSLTGTMSVADVDAGTANVTVGLSVNSGFLSATAGTTGVTVFNSGTPWLTFSGTVTQVNNLLAGNLGATLNYVVASDSPPATDDLNLWIDDNGATGIGG